MAITF
jgi:hypothetical protein